MEFSYHRSTQMRLAPASAESENGRWETRIQQSWRTSVRTDCSRGGWGWGCAAVGKVGGRPDMGRFWRESGLIAPWQDQRQRGKCGRTRNGKGAGTGRFQWATALPLLSANGRLASRRTGKRGKNPPKKYISWLPMAASSFEWKSQAVLLESRRSVKCPTLGLRENAQFKLA